MKRLMVDLDTKNREIINQLIKDLCKINEVKWISLYSTNKGYHMIILFEDNYIIEKDLFGERVLSIEDLIKEILLIYYDVVDYNFFKCCDQLRYNCLRTGKKYALENDEVKVCERTKLEKVVKNGV